MGNIKIGRYQDECGYLGWVEPEKKSERKWILFVREDHSVEMYIDRDPETGAVL